MTTHQRGFWRNPYNWIGLALSLACIFLIAQKMDFARVWTALAQADYWWVVLALTNVVLILALKAVRWRLLFYPEHKGIGYRELFAALTIGVLINFASPVRLGDVVRGYLVGAKRRNVAHTMGTIAVEKLVDVIALAVMLLALVPTIALPDWLLRPSWILGAVALGLLTSFALVRGKIVDLFAFVEGKISLAHRLCLADRAKRGLDSMSPLLHWSPLFQLWGWTAIIWGISSLTNYLVFRAMHLDLSLGAAFFLLAVLQASIALPSSPGKLGVFHYACLIVLLLLGVERDIAIGYAVLLYLVVNGPPALLGIVLLWGQGYTLATIREVFTRKGDALES